IEYYISRSIRNAAYIAVLTDTDFSDVQSKGNSVITELRGKTDSNYSLKCISIRYAMDDKSQTYKYFICNETVESSGALKTNSTPASDTMVFDPCYFDGIYPKVIISRVQQEQSDGSKKDMPAVQIDVEIFDDPLMRGGKGDTTASPTSSDLVFSGTGYTVLRNIELSQQDTSLNQPFKITEPLPKSLNPGDNSFKETYIFYVERKLAATPTTT
ncbi:MAG: hypothetical protein K2O14_06975, partial [Oscillospiraceae bacterium]|nr:hypothetical protein [Oscillospiraceae bacterium]